MCCVVWLMAQRPAVCLTATCLLWVGRCGRWVWAGHGGLAPCLAPCLVLVWAALGGAWVCHLVVTAQVRRVWQALGPARLCRCAVCLAVCLCCFMAMGALGQAAVVVWHTCLVMWCSGCPMLVCHTCLVPCLMRVWAVRRLQLQRLGTAVQCQVWTAPCC